MKRLVALVALLSATGMCAAAPRPGDQVKFTKIVLDKEFRSEGAAVADVNHDGKLDVLAGDMWYEAPNWTPHEIRPPQKYDGATGYSNAFLVFAEDINKDGWTDEIVIGFPGFQAVWRENPKGKLGPWTEHLIWRSACAESPNYGDLLGNKKPVLVFPYDEKFMAWYEVGKDPNAEFICHTVSVEGAPGVVRFAHGTGIGDVNGDGRADILCKDGWWEQPADPRTGPWPWHAVSFGPECAQMLVYDVNKDGLPDVITTSAHNRGVWWYEQRKTANGVEFVQHEIDNVISETHSVCLADINGDGVMDIVTGKRFWAHGPHGDVGPDEPAVLVWYELSRKDGKVEWKKHQIDDDSGVGTQFTVADLNKDGRPDVIVSNKKGVAVFIQER